MKRAKHKQIVTCARARALTPYAKYINCVTVSTPFCMEDDKEERTKRKENRRYDTHMCGAERKMHASSANICVTVSLLLCALDRLKYFAVMRNTREMKKDIYIVMGLLRISSLTPNKN